MLRRLICCVLAIEIAEHERRAVFDQIRVTQALRRLLADATGALPASDVIAIPREDGALMAFNADSAACFQAALAVREACLSDERYRDLQPRIGIDLGPVELLQEEAGQAYLGGEGRRDAERLMRHAAPCRISVTRSFFELLSRAAPDLAARLKYQGLMTDAVGRPLGWYALDPAADRPARDIAGGAENAAAAAPVGGADRLLRRLRLGVLPLVALAAALVPVSAWRASTDAERAEARAGAVEDAASDDSRSIAPAVGLDVPTPDTRRVDQEREGDLANVREASGPVAAAPAAAAMPVPSPAQEPGAARPERAVPAREAEPDPHHAPEARGAGKVRVRLAVKPWGEVRVNGRAAAVTPPVKTLHLAPGRYEIAITNGLLPPYRRRLEVRAGAEPLTLSHDFTCVATRDRLCPEAADTPLLASSRLRPRTARDRAVQPLEVAGRAGRPDLARLPALPASGGQVEAVAAR